ncbi:MAG: M23 family metallopeptidase [Candidatus Bathyarchaeota archaeon]|nr:M23 family metallopeptidase [Candidatus Bathyarchaeota archaeon]
MKPVVESMGVKLYCPRDGRFAFFNSPYPAHKENTGVDIYPGDGFGGEAVSPVDGEVTLIRRVKAPSGHGFEASDHDTVVLIRNRDNPETVTKLLHIDPVVELGETVRVGDSIGVTLRSGYYGWGTSPHLHVEIRKPDDPIRARGGYNLNLIDARYADPLEEIAGNVVHLQPEYALIKLDTSCTGLMGTVNGEPAIIEGGIPYYGWVGAHIENPPESGSIELLGEPISTVTERFHQSCKGTGNNYGFMIKNEKILGLSLTLWANYQPLVKAIPLKKGGLKLEKDEWVKVELKVS